MAKIGIFLWALFFIVLGFSMMPGTMMFVIVISFIGGLIDGILRIKKLKKEQNEKWRMRDEALDDFSPIW